jgi:hypothetical protein
VFDQVNRAHQNPNEKENCAMATRKQDLQKLEKELEKLQASRGDDKAWRKQLESVNKASDQHRSHYRAGRPVD